MRYINNLKNISSRIHSHMFWLFIDVIMYYNDKKIGWISNDVLKITFLHYFVENNCNLKGNTFNFLKHVLKYKNS